MSSPAVTPARLALVRRAPCLRPYLASRLVSEVGTWLAYVALTVDVYGRTGSPRWIAGVVAAGVAPSIVAAPVVGSLADRVARRRLLVGAEVAGAAVFAVLPFVGEPMGIVALAATAGVAQCVFAAAASAGLPNLVADDDLERANALVQTVSTAGVAIGPLAAGVVVAAAGPHVVYDVNAVSYALSALVLLRIHPGALDRAAHGSQTRPTGALEGVRLFLRERRLTALLLGWALMCVAGSAVNVGEILIAKDALHAGTVGFGLLASGSGAGLVLGSLGSATVVRRLPGIRGFAVGLLVWAAGAACVGGAPALVVATAAALVLGAGNALSLAAGRVAVQRAVDDRTRGRAFAVLFGVGNVGVGVGMVLGGAIGGVAHGRGAWLAAAALLGTAGAIVAPAARDEAPAPVLEPI
jgi:MFS family permease